MTTPVPGGDSTLPDITFPTFLLSLAQTALTWMGELAHPETGKVEIDLDVAKQNIDIMELLEHKTRGNLEPDEAELLKTLLYDLRMKYVAKRRG